MSHKINGSLVIEDVIKVKTMKDNTISASLIYRKIEGKLSVVEEERFEAWLKEGREHREYYERMRRMYQQENVQDSWDWGDSGGSGRCLKSVCKDSGGLKGDSVGCG